MIMDTISNNSYWYIGMMEQVECEQEIFMSLIESKYYEVNGIIQEGFSFKEARQKIINAFKKAIQFFKNIFINIKYALKKKRLEIDNSLEDKIKQAKSIIKDNPNFQQTKYCDYSKELKDSNADKLVKISQGIAKIMDAQTRLNKKGMKKTIEDYKFALQSTLSIQKELMEELEKGSSETKITFQAYKKTIQDEINHSLNKYQSSIDDDEFIELLDQALAGIKFLREEVPETMETLVWNMVVEKNSYYKATHTFKSVEEYSFSLNQDKLTIAGEIKSVYDIDTLGSQCKRLLSNHLSYEKSLDKISNIQDGILNTLNSWKDYEDSDSDIDIKVLDTVYETYNAIFTVLRSIVSRTSTIYSQMLRFSLYDLNLFIHTNGGDANNN